MIPQEKSHTMSISYGRIFMHIFWGFPATVGSCHCRNRVTKRTGAESLTHSCDARDFQVSTEPGDQVDLAQSCWTI